VSLRRAPHRLSAPPSPLPGRNRLAASRGRAARGYECDRKRCNESRRITATTLIRVAVQLLLDNPAAIRWEALGEKIEAATRAAATELLATEPAEFRQQAGDCSDVLVRTRVALCMTAQIGAGVILPLRGCETQSCVARAWGAALMVAADPSGADLRVADVLGANLRGADLTGADLRGAIFLTQCQLNSARGSLTTVLPEAFAVPTHWASGAAEE